MFNIFKSNKKDEVKPKLNVENSTSNKLSQKLKRIDNKTRDTLSRIPGFIRVISCADGEIDIKDTGRNNYIVLLVNENFIVLLRKILKSNFA